MSLSEEQIEDLRRRFFSSDVVWDIDEVQKELDMPIEDIYRLIAAPKRAARKRSVTQHYSFADTPQKTYDEEGIHELDTIDTATLCEIANDAWNEGYRNGLRHQAPKSRKMVLGELKVRAARSYHTNSIMQTYRLGYKLGEADFLNGLADQRRSASTASENSASESDASESG